MSNTGRYYVRDPKSGRLFCVEPIFTRSQRRDDKTWDVGGAPWVTGGAISPEESVITEANGFTNIVDLPPGTSPDAYIDQLLKLPRA